MRTLFAAILLLSAGALARTEDRDVPEFSSVHVCCGITAAIEIGPRKALHIEGADESLAALGTVVTGGDLAIFYRPNTNLRGERHLKVSIQTPSLRGVGASGGSIVRASLTRGQSNDIQASGGSEIHLRGVDAARLSAQASGGSILTISGEADSLDLQLSGGSQLHGHDLSVKDLDIQGSGGSQADLRASGSIHGGLSGGSQLHARGAARTRVSTSGGSQVDIDD